MRTALIFGASSGIGMELAIQLTDAGWLVYGAARTMAKLEAIKADHHGFMPVACDVTDQAQVQAAFATATEQNVLNAVVTTAGAYVYDVPLEKVARESWDKIIAINGTGTLFVAQEAAKIFRSRLGVFVAVSSLAGLNHRVWPNRVEYSAAKAMVTTIGESFHRELVELESPSRAFVVCPGLVDTALVKDWLEKHPEAKGSGITAQAAAEAIYQLVAKPETFPTRDWLYTLDQTGLQVEPDPA